MTSPAPRGHRLQVFQKVIDDALDYMKASQDPVSGRFRYRINEPKMSWSLTAAALSTLNSAGDYSSDMLQQGFDALQRWDPYIGQPEDENWIEYGAFYAAQAYWQHGDGRAVARWWPRFVRPAGRAGTGGQLERRRVRDGVRDRDRVAELAGAAGVSADLPAESAAQLSS
jgi:hypothetical protein